MNTTELIGALDAEITRLKQAKAILDGDQRGNGRTGRPANAVSFDHGVKRSTMSPEGRARIAAAQRARWAKSRRVD